MTLLLNKFIFGRVPNLKSNAKSIQKHENARTCIKQFLTTKTLASLVYEFRFVYECVYGSPSTDYGNCGV